MSDNRGRDGGFRGGRQGDKKPAYGEKKSFGDKKPYGEKKSFGDKKPYGEKKSFGDKKPYGEKKSFGDKPAYGEKKPYGEKRSFGDKPAYGEKKPYGEKRSFGDKPAYGEKKPYGEKRSFGDKPSFGDKKPYGEKRSFGDKPAYGEKKPYGEKRSFGDKPAFGEKKPYAPRPNGDRPHGDRKPFPPRGEKRGMPNLAPRRVALETLLDVSTKDAYASLAMDKRLAQAMLNVRDRAFVTQLVYGTLENRITLDWRIDQFLNGENELEPTIREILRMGAYQLFYLDRVPDMAAVDESVSLARAMGFEGMTGLVNAVLRNMIRGQDNVVWPKPAEDPIKYLSIMFSVPRELARLLVEAYGEHEALEILRYRPKDRDVTIRVNYLRCDDTRLRALLADSELEFTQGVVPGTYKVKHAGDLTRMRAFQNGLFTIQGESSVIAARMVGAKPGQTVLDACAAPGGKTAVLSEMMNDTGRVYAWDTHAHRVELIRGTANRLKLENVRPAVKDASAPREDMALTLDAALIDAPCSGTGVMLEKPDVRYRVSESGVAALCRTQSEILDAIAPMIKVGGTLVYSTCSILPQENGAQVRAFLARHPEYEVAPMAAELPETLAAHEAELGLQMLAHRDGTDGFYVCRMKRVRL